MMGAIRVWTGGSPSTHLTGQRIYLRAPTDRDWRVWAELRAASRAFLEPWEPVWPHDSLTRENYRRRLRQISQEWREDSAYSFHILRQGDNALLGGITLSNVRRGVAQCGTLGYWIGRPYARSGFMSEALHRVVEFSFGQLGLHRLEAACLPNNEASRGLLLKNGFTEEGYARKYLRIHGAWQDHLLFGLVQDDPREKP
jgi:[ribosomal protein S5]-alanine N-acetyltransferase